MSQDYHQGIFSFTNGLQQQQQQQQHIAQQIRRDKLRGYEQPPPPLVGIEEEEESGGGGGGGGSGGGLPVYETAGMLSEMFNFPHGATGSSHAAAELQQQTHQVVLTNNEWYSSSSNHHHQRQNLGPDLGLLTHDVKNHNSRESTATTTTTNNHHISGINADSAAAMQLFLMNPQPRSPSTSPSPAPVQAQNSTSESTIHMLLPNPSSTPPPPLFHGFTHHHPNQLPGQGAAFGSGTVISPQQLNWVHDTTTHEGGNTGVVVGGNIIESQGLSLSLSSSLQQLEVAKAEELRMGDGGLLYYGHGGGGGSSSGGGGSGGGGYNYKNYTGHNQQQTLHLQGVGSVGVSHPVHVGFGSASLGVVNVLRNSKYAKPAQELLEEFCSVGRGQFKKNKFGKVNTNPSGGGGSGGGGGGGSGGSSSSTKELPTLSASDRIEHQRRKVKLLSMLDEVDRRYNHYCEQMQMVVNSFDLVMGYGAAVPYTALAQKAMSRHFRCLKDAIAAQLKHSCELLGEKDAAGTSGITKGETPRLKVLDQSLRQQRAFHQMGIMEQEAWRPQRGLPERSVNILRAWLFEHFLHPYPSDADKHLLSRQTGLSRNQVSNWFINARVRLWKPMIEEMYQQESKDLGQDQEVSTTDQDRDQMKQISSPSKTNTKTNFHAQTPTHTKTTTTTTIATTTALSTPIPTTTTTTTTGKRSEINASESDSSLLAISTTQCNFSENPVAAAAATTTTMSTTVNMAVPPQVPHQAFHDLADQDTCLRGSYLTADNYGTTSNSGNVDMGSSTLIRFGTTTTTTAGGDVSLTLGLRHAGNNNMAHDKSGASSFSIRDFGSCSFN